MKYSTLSFIISSSILLHACGSSNDIQNHTTDPKPNHNSQHQSNSHNINGNQSSNNSNQATNTSQNSNQQQNDFTPNISSGNAPNPKNNIIISSNNHDDDNDAPIPAPPKINLDTLTKEQADQLAKKAGEKLKKLEPDLKNIDNEVAVAQSGYNAAKGKVEEAITGVAAAKTEEELKTAKEVLAAAQKLADQELNNFVNANKKGAKLKAQKIMAEKEQNLANNAQRFVNEKNEKEPKAVLDEIRKQHAVYEAEAEGLELSAKKQVIDSKSTAIETKIKTLMEINEKLKSDVTEKSGVDKKAKDLAKDEIKKNDEEIAKLTKQKQGLDKESDALNLPIDQAAKTTEYAEKALKEAKKDVVYRGVYGDGSFASSSFQAVDKVIHDPAEKTWTLTLNGVETPLVINTDFPTNGYSDFRSKVNGFFKKDDDGKINAYSTLANKDGTATLESSIYGYTGDGKFFSVGKVAPESAAITGKFNGKSFLTARGDDKEIPLVSDITVTIAPQGKTLTGELKNFISYEKGKRNVNSKQYHELNKSFASTYSFTSEIKGNKFIPTDVADQAKAYGYFYGEQANEIGGLVKHDKFEGAFGAKKNN